MPRAVQEKMEAFFGTSFADVRVHVGNEASSIGALAFTHGTDLYFAPGQYNPQTVPGQQLLGHELTHVVQQRAGRVRNPIASGVAVVQDPALEAEAERMGTCVATASPPIQAKRAGAGPGVAPLRPTGSRSAGTGAILPVCPPLNSAAQRKPAPTIAPSAAVLRLKDSVAGSSCTPPSIQLMESSKGGRKGKLADRPQKLGGNVKRNTEKDSTGRFYALVGTEEGSEILHQYKESRGLGGKSLDREELAKVYGESEAPSSSHARPHTTKNRPRRSHPRIFMNF